MARHLRFASLALALCGFVLASAHAWEKPPIKCDCGINVRFDIKYGATNEFKAPWYTYFPYDPHLHPCAGGNPYPNWPAQPPATEGAADRQSQSNRFPNWPTQVPGARNNGTLTAYSSPASARSPESAWQLPSGNQVPSYWYGR